MDLPKPADDIPKRIKQRSDCYEKFKKACEAQGGDGYECLRLGIIYCDEEFGFPVPHDEEWAKPFLKRDEEDNGYFYIEGDRFKEKWNLFESN